MLDHLEKEDSQDSVADGRPILEGSIDPHPQATVAEMRLQLVQWCSEAFQLCVRRFSNHYKSHYWLAEIYFATDEMKVSLLGLFEARLPASTFQDYTKSRQVLLGPVSIPECQVHSGLFQHRKPTNYFEVSSLSLGYSREYLKVSFDFSRVSGESHWTISIEQAHSRSTCFEV